ATLNKYLLQGAGTSQYQQYARNVLQGRTVAPHEGFEIHATRDTQAERRIDHRHYQNDGRLSKKGGSRLEPGRYVRRISKGGSRGDQGHGQERGKTTVERSRQSLFGQS